MMRTGSIPVKAFFSRATDKWCTYNKMLRTMVTVIYMYVLVSFICHIFKCSIEYEH